MESGSTLIRVKRGEEESCQGDNDLVWLFVFQEPFARVIRLLAMQLGLSPSPKNTVARPREHRYTRLSTI